MRNNDVVYKEEDEFKPDGGGEKGDGDEGLHAAEVESIVDEGRIQNAGSLAPTPLIYSGHPCLYLSLLHGYLISWLFI